MKLTALEALRADELNLPPGYYAELDADLMELYRPDGSLVAAFSARGTTTAVVVRIAEKDYRTHGKSSS